MTRIAAALGRRYKLLQKRARAQQSVRMQGCSAQHEGGMDQWTKRGEMPSICVYFPGAAVLSEETQVGVYACYVSRQVPGDKCGMVRMTFPVSLMCMCRRSTQSVPVVWGKLCLWGNSITRFK